ncbi:hypothetical protein J1P26_17155 [Neobacillus sp. MM2021_6]|uniref:hypothetical protein n=1 Tax=Bacillaceae TaxID=186817 RepID=UPI00140BF90E|nr:MULTISPECIES: hypothetical protein [Bacillaceae]MBO0961436.1 hypothetical protein [Neobacillus sp. MM2021_6]NHC19541.1 hypothetical protein [Bacillus sp. MM2020_4]
MDKQKVYEVFNDLLEEWYSLEVCFPDLLDKDIKDIEKKKQCYIQRFHEASAIVKNQN